MLNGFSNPLIEKVIVTPLWHSGDIVQALLKTTVLTYELSVANAELVHNVFTDPILQVTEEVSK